MSPVLESNMTAYHLDIAPHAPIIARDGRPFGLGQRMRSLRWPYPSVLSGSFRTMFGKRIGGQVAGDPLRLMQGLEIAGPLPVGDRGLYLPAPRDLLADPDGRVHILSPQPLGDGEHANFPGEAASLRPAMLDPDVEDFKPAPLPPFWPVNLMTQWLRNPAAASRFLPEKLEQFRRPGNRLGAPFWKGPDIEERIHVQIDPETFASADRKLYVTSGLGFPPEIWIGARVRVRDWASDLEEHLSGLDAVHPLGGERRLVSWKVAGPERSDLWSAPESVRQELNRVQSGGGIRMVLATPAVFRRGWIPDGLDENLEGVLPGCSGVRLRLVSAIVERWAPVSGFNLLRGKAGAQGPKPTRRLVPAGSVYFFELVSGDPAGLASSWLCSVCGDSRDRRDGFGLAVWGLWNNNPKESHSAATQTKG